MEEIRREMGRKDVPKDTGNFKTSESEVYRVLHHPA